MVWEVELLLGFASVLSAKYSRTSIFLTSIIRISRLSGVFLASQFGHEYLLVTIKIRSHIVFETTALKGAVKWMLLIPGTGNGERGTGNGEPGTGVWELMYSGNPLENSKWRSKQKKRLEEKQFRLR